MYGGCVYNGSSIYSYALIEVIGHRGVLLLEPENTLLGFRRALGLGANQLELDIRLTKDRVPVVIHDATLKRTTNGRGRISKLTLSKIRAFDAGKGEGVPTLEEVLKEFGGKVFLHIHLKGRVSPAPVVRIVAKMKLERSVCISSFSHKSLMFVKRLNPHISTAALTRKRRRRLIPYLHRLGVDALHVPYAICTKNLVRALHNGGLKVRVWRVGVSTTKMEKLLSWKVDGIIVDRADILHRLVRSRSKK
jgi:glycerophosphoryl diester phosphodiesterase